MPRNYGRTSTSIWRDKDFRKLSPEARFVYSMLFNQPNVTAVGVLELTTTRWAGNTGYPVETVEAALSELVERAYLLVDRETEEVFIRSFVRWDGGANNDLRRKAIRDSAAAVASDDIRASIAVELDRINVPHDLSKPPQSPIEGRRVVVKEGDHNPNPQPSTHEGEPEPFDASAEPPAWCSKHPGGTETPCGPCGTAVRRNRAWRNAKPERERRERAARQALIDACDGCDNHGMVLDLDTLKPLGKCNHHLTEIDTRKDNR